MTRLSTLLALYVGLGGHFFQTAVEAAGTTKCSTTLTASPSRASSGSAPSSQVPSASGVPSHQQAYGTGVSSSGRASTGTASSSRRAPSGTASSSGRASSGTASSSRQSLSGTGSSASASCFPYSTTTSYITQTTRVPGPILALNTTGTRYEYATIVTETATTPYTSFEFAYIATTTVTRTFSSSSISVIPAATTVTVPTPAGFTPILCLPAWRNPRVTTTITESFTSYTYPIVTSTYTTPVTVTSYTSTTISTTTQSFTTEVQVFQTVTSVTTRDNPTSTVYDACATNNVVSEGPGGEDLSIPLPLDFSAITLKLVPALDPTDCCSLCQADSTCTATIGSYPDLPTDNRYSCQFLVKTASANATCDPAYKALDATNQNQNSQTSLSLWLSNGPCGQFV